MGEDTSGFFSRVFTQHTDTLLQGSLGRASVPTWLLALTLELLPWAPGVLHAYSTFLPLAPFPHLAHSLSASLLSVSPPMLSGLSGLHPGSRFIHYSSFVLRALRSWDR